MLLPPPATSPGFLLRQFGVRKWGKEDILSAKDGRCVHKSALWTGLGWAGEERKCVAGRVSVWRGPIVWNAPAVPVRGQLPARPPWVRASEVESPAQSGASPNPVYWIGLHRMGAVFPLSPTALLSARTVNVHLEAQLALGKICKNFVCAQCVPGGMEGVERALWRCLGAGACRGGAALFMLQGLPRMCRPWQCCGQQEKHSWHLNERQQFLSSRIIGILLLS